MNSSSPKSTWTVDSLFQGNFTNVLNKKGLIAVGLTMLCMVLCSFFLFVIVNSYAMNGMVESEIEELISAAETTEPRKYTSNDLENLPAPVQRYFRHVLKEGQDHIRFIRMKAVGQFRRPLQKKWTELAADQYFTANPPGMIFDAVMKQGLQWYDIRDKYWKKAGGMCVNIFSGVTVLREDDIRELDKTAFLRWIGEAVLFPTALLPSDFITWLPIDGNRATLEVADGENTGSYIVTFNDTGEIVKMESDNRHERIDGTFQKAGSIAFRSNYKEMGGIKVPVDFSITRILPDGTHEEFWKGEVVDISYDTMKKY